MRVLAVAVLHLVVVAIMGRDQDRVLGVLEVNVLKGDVLHRPLAAGPGLDPDTVLAANARVGDESEAGNRFGLGAAVLAQGTNAETVAAGALEVSDQKIGDACGVVSESWYLFFFFSLRVPSLTAIQSSPLTIVDERMVTLEDAETSKASVLWASYFALSDLAWRFSFSKTTFLHPLMLKWALGAWLMEKPPKYELVALGLKSGGALRFWALYLETANEYIYMWARE